MIYSPFETARAGFTALLPKEAKQLIMGEFGRKAGIKQELALAILLLLLVTPIVLSNTLTQAQASLEITFDRQLSGDRVGQHKVPPLSPVNMTITVTVPSQVDNAVLIDYSPSDWTVTDPSGGVVSVYDENYDKIEWNVGTVSDSVSRSYVVRSPQLTSPPTNYYFRSELTYGGGSATSGDWMVIVADPPDEESGSPYLLIVQGAPEKGSRTWWGWVVVNPTNSTITVTEVRVKDNAGTDWNWGVDVQGYPTENWADGGADGLYWSGSENISAHSATYFRVRAAQGGVKELADHTMIWTAMTTENLERSSVVVGIDKGSWGGMFYNKPGDTTEQTEIGTYADGLYAYLDVDENDDNLNAGTEYVFYVNVHEWAGKAIDPGGTLTITIPKEFTNVALVDNTDFTNAAVSGGGTENWTIQGTNDSAISNDVIHLSFKATTPSGYSTKSNWEFDTRFTGTGDKGETVRYICEADVLVMPPPAAWRLIETWAGTVKTPVEWQLIETWTGTIEAPAVWQIIETWIGTVQAPIEWQIVEIWTGTVEAPAGWNLIETWTGVIEASAEWRLIEAWTGVAEAPAAWQLIETWTGTVSAPAEWQLIETWTGTVSAPIAWQLIETWTGTASAPAAWQLIETWTGTVSAPAEWQLIETWTGTVSAPIAWQLIESWTGTASAPAEWKPIETRTGTVSAPAAWLVIETWTGTVQNAVLPRTPHDPIYIRGNENFTPTNGVLGGSGTENSPYIIENWLISAESSDGIMVRNTDAYFIIRNCLVENGGSSYDGFYLDNVANGKIENCTAKSNWNGVYLEESSYNTVANNNLSNNNSDGIQLWDSSNNTVVRNDVSNNSRIGIDLRISDNNLIYHNNFVSNENQTYDDGSNYWDGGYPSGGNYWSDYIGADNYRGENQDILGYDGIGDTSYNIPGDNNRDRYPLMRPWSPYKLTRHYPILISGDNDFIPANGVVLGTGADNDPYIIENWAIDASTTHGIWIKNTTAYFIVRNVLVENGGLDCHGIYLKDVVHGRVKNSVFRNNLYGIYLRYSSKNTLSQNTTSNNRGHGIHLSYSSNNILNNNICENNYWYGIALHPYSSNNILDNNICQYNKIGIRIQDWSDNNTIINNTCSNNTYGIRLHSSDNSIMDNNTCSNNYQGIYLDSSGDVKMRNNILSKNQYNFSVTGTTISHFVHDIDSSNLVNGKSIRYLVDNKDEVIAPPLDVGYLALVNCDNIRVENLALGNNDQGILLVSTKNSRMMNCVLENNFRGIHLYSSDNNFIYHNNFVSNENQAYDDGSNFWDDGYPSGGNYWSDYKGGDNYRGENQDILGGDGIGDTPYYISGDTNADRYPFMNPWPPTIGVEVSISPSRQGGPPGATLTYVVKVTNTGTVDDTYNLTVIDNTGWVLMLASNLLENVEPDEEKTTILTVAIPDNENLIGVKDNITVTATSQENVEVSDNASCIAYAGEQNTFYLNLAKGWNIVSFPVTGENTTPDNLFAGVSYTMKYYVAPYGPFREPRPDQPVELGVGYLLKLDNNKTITVTGIPVENYTMDLVAGWQIVSFPVTSASTTPANLFAGMTYTMKYYVAPYGPFKEQKPNDPVELGVGYLLKLDNSKTITIPL